MDKVTLSTIMNLVLLVAMLFVTASRINIVKKMFMLLASLVATFWLCGCSTPKNDEDISIILGSKGTVIKTEVFDSGHCKVIIKDDNGLLLGIIKKDSSPCAKFKKSDRVSFSVVLQPSLIAPGSIEKL